MNLEAGSEAKAMEECCWLACSPWLAQAAFSHHSETPIHGWPCPPQTAPSHIHQIKKMPPQTALQANLIWHFLSWDSLLPELSRFSHVDRNQPTQTVTGQKIFTWLFKCPSRPQSVLCWRPLPDHLHISVASGALSTMLKALPWVSPFPGSQAFLTALSRCPWYSFCPSWGPQIACESSAGLFFMWLPFPLQRSNKNIKQD